jgi:hypothetical protein
MTESSALEVRHSSVDQRLLAIFEAAQRWIYEQGLVLVEIESILGRAGPASFSTCTRAASRQRSFLHPSGLRAN